jgi:hypothetical protein
MHRLAWNLILLVPALAISGCGSSQSIWVQGKLTRDGAKYVVPADQSLSMTFTSMEPFQDGGRTIPAGQPYMAVFKSEDGTFTVAGPDGLGIPPGKYRVSLTQKLTREAVDRKNEKVKRNQTLFERDTDMLEGRFGDNSPIVTEIKDSNEVTIDLGKVDTTPQTPQAAKPTNRSSRD